MFGYVRPNKGELLVREFSRFRSVYCGICKEISRSYGQLPRIALTYDITVLGLLLISLTQEGPKEIMARCILNPVKKRPMLTDHVILHRCAALSVLLAYGKFQDEILDGNPVIGTAGKLLLKRAAKTASSEYPVEAVVIQTGLRQLREIEKTDRKCDRTKDAVLPYETASAEFGSILRIVFKESFRSYFGQEHHRESLLEGIAQLGFHLGRWIFIIDAIDDYEQDKRSKNWNPFMRGTWEEAQTAAGELLLDSESRLDRIAALLPYTRDANIISNIIQDGLPTVRKKVFLRQKLGRL